MAQTDGGTPTRDLMSDTWTAIDGLGRELPGSTECGPPRPGRFAGIFYFLWLGAHSKQVHDISRILAANPESPQFGPVHAFHHWGEPHLGYYLSHDEAVIRRHAQMLTEAGLDVLLFLDTDRDPRNGWEGFDFVVNRGARGDGTARLERSTGGWGWEPVADVRYATAGNELHLAIPRAVLGLAPDRGPLRLDLKWADNGPESGDIRDFLDQGDTAPNGRFRYRYEE